MKITNVRNSNNINKKGIDMPLGVIITLGIIACLIIAFLIFSGDAGSWFKEIGRNLFG